MKTALKTTFKTLMLVLAVFAIAACGGKKKSTSKSGDKSDKPGSEKPGQTVDKATVNTDLNTIAAKAVLLSESKVYIILEEKDGALTIKEVQHMAKTDEEKKTADSAQKTFASSVDKVVTSYAKAFKVKDEEKSKVLKADAKALLEAMKAQVNEALTKDAVATAPADHAKTIGEQLESLLTFDAALDDVKEDAKKLNGVILRDGDGPSVPGGERNP